MEYSKIADATKNGIIEEGFDIMVHDEIANREYKNVVIEDVTKNVILVKHSKGHSMFVYSSRSVVEAASVTKVPEGYQTNMANGNKFCFNKEGKFIG